MIDDSKKKDEEPCQRRKWRKKGKKIWGFEPGKKGEKKPQKGRHKVRATKGGWEWLSKIFPMKFRIFFVRGEKGGEETWATKPRKKVKRTFFWGGPTNG